MTMNMTLIVILNMPLTLSMDRSGRPSPPGAAQPTRPTAAEDLVQGKSGRFLQPAISS